MTRCSTRVSLAGAGSGLIMSLCLICMPLDITDLNICYKLGAAPISEILLLVLTALAMCKVFGHAIVPERAACQV